MGLESLRQNRKQNREKNLTRKERKQKETSCYSLIISETDSVKSEHREGEEKEGKLEEKVKS